MAESAAVGDEIPEPAEAAEALEGGEVEVPILEDFVGRTGIVTHGPVGVVTGETGAAESFENAELDFLGTEREEAVEAVGEGVEGFAGQTGDEIGMNVDASPFAKEAEVVFETGEVLTAADAGADVGIEGLNADLELKSARGEPGDLFAQGLGEAVPADDAEARRACSFITAEIDRLGSVVSSLLGFARPPRLAPRPVAVGTLFEQAMLLARQDLAAKDIRVRRADAPSLPEVQADSDLVVQVLLGLLANAADAVPPGGEVTLDARAANGMVEIAVADSGPGIPEELRARVFEPFFTTRDKGTGLGLAVARQIVEAHQGRIEVADGPGGGARFRITLPEARPDAPLGSPA